MKICEKCTRPLKEDNFYTYRNGEKTELCKNCLTMHINNFDPETYVWLLEKMDVPYAPWEWESLLEKAYAKNPDGLTGTSVFGKYLSKMKLNQWKDKRWADTEAVQAKHAKEMELLKEAQAEGQAMLQEQLEQGVITEAQFKTMTKAKEQEKARPLMSQVANAFPSMFDETSFMDEEAIPDPGENLTMEDKLALAIKWGRLYKPSEWVELERTYEEMVNSFDIQDPDTINTLILLCKTNLKMNQAIDSGDFDGYQKLSRVYDAMRKSAHFTAAQNKEDKGDAIDSIGKLINICENEGFIPRYVTDVPQDKVDLTLRDMNEYLRKLVTQDLGFGQQIEDSIKKIQLSKEYDEAVAAAGENEEEYYDSIEDPDIQEYYENIAEEAEQDALMLESDSRSDNKWLQQT